jgi:hypothetical protein
MTPKFPDVFVQLSENDGNAFAILGAMHRGLKKGGATQEQIAEFDAEAMSGDYDHLLQTCILWVEVG